MPEAVAQKTEERIWDSLISPQSIAYDKYYDLFTHLVHYCDFAALNGIISQKEIWLSPVALMNDYNELRKGQKLFKRFAQDGEPLQDLGRALQDTQVDLFNLLSDEFNNRLHSDWTNSYVSCWSMRDIPSNEHDDLTMWRGYASEGNGVAIVIDHSKINPEGDFAGEIVASPVLYETEENFAIRAKECLESFFDNLMKLDPKVRLENKSIVARAFGELCFHLAITHKHLGFAAEKEWRFI